MGFAEIIGKAVKEKAMAEEPTQEEKTDIFYAQEKMIGSLMDILNRQDQPVYIAPPAPIQQPRNYLLWIAIGLGILIYMGKIKL